MHPIRVVIIGGGIAGAGLAAVICRSCEVTVLEQESRTGYHSTGRSAAAYIESYGNSVIRRLNRSSRAFFERPDGIAGGSLLSPRGMLVLASESSSAGFDELLASSAAVAEINLSESLSLVPILRGASFTRAAYEREASDIDVDRLHQGWLRLAQSQGTQLKLNSPVTDFDRQGTLWLVRCGEQHYTADIVVNAAGAWADSIAELAGVPKKSLTPLRRTAALVQLTGEHDVRDWPLFSEITETWYAKPEAGKLMISPADEDPVPAADAWVDDLVLAEGIDRFESAVTETVTKVEHSWAGLRTFAPDNTPVVGFDPVADGFFWLAGHGGYGIQTSPALSLLAADLLLGKPGETAVSDRLSPARDFTC